MKSKEYKVYINCRTAEGVETIEEFSTADFKGYKDMMTEARRVLNEYALCYTDPVWLSNRSTKEWRNRE